MNGDWPTLEDRIFVPGGNRNLAGHLLNPIVDFPAKFGPVAGGFKAAGDALVDWLETNPRDDSLVSPLIFCYRQYVELKLKDIAVLVNAIEGTVDNHKSIHNLQYLFDPLKSDIEQCLGEDDQETLAAVECIIMQFNNADCDSTTFRFLDRRMPFHQVDLGNLRVVMGKLANFLDSLTDYLEAAWAKKQ